MSTPDSLQPTYLQGDATNPQAKGNKIIAHVCNDVGGWGKGFVLALSKRWPEPERSYRAWYRERTGNDFALGYIQTVQVEPCIWVANMIAQRGMKAGSKGVPIQYEAVQECLKKLTSIALELEASVHMPRIGCGLAGGKWEMIEPLIQNSLMIQSIPTYVYDY
jgi:O-acetyl-ADP-ribose deacetylase (regulator of RNase III)